MKVLKVIIQMDLVDIYGSEDGINQYFQSKSIFYYGVNQG